MAASKKKKVSQKEIPSNERRIVQKKEPESYYDKNPSWNFHTCDNEMWSFSKENAGDYIWSEIIPHLKGLESQTWNEIFLLAKKQNHSISCLTLNPIAQKRLSEKYIEAESLCSLRLNGTHRIYGYMNGSVFNILWFDPCHGDNDKCVCRSTKKHT